LISGLKNPHSVAVGMGGRIFVTTMGELGKDGDGAVLVLEGGKAVPFATGLDDPRGLAGFQEWLFTADKRRIWRISRQGKAEVFVPATAFPSPPRLLCDLAVDSSSGTLYVSDAGDPKGAGGAVYRVSPQGKVDVPTDAKRTPALKSPRGLALDGVSHLLVLDSGPGVLYRLKLAGGTLTRIADGLGSAEGLVWDHHGRLYVTDRKGGRVLAIGRPGTKPVLLTDGFQAPADLGLDPTGKLLLVPDRKAGTVTALPTGVPDAAVDERPLALEPAVAFPDVRWAGWKPATATGIPTPLRPIVLTHAGDGSNRVFVATQHGVIHVFPNSQRAKKTKVFLDIQKHVTYSDAQNEEGFLGLAFHPKYSRNGEFFVFYTVKKPSMTNVLARYRVSRQDPDRADPASEKVLLRVTRPFWNHDGGTLCFGADGYLYVALGDGGSANDPYGNGQNLKTLLGKVLRIDVDRKDKGKKYAVPRDNPFVAKSGARPEIWAYGLRNIWRMAFDRKTGTLWAGDVGQDLFEEIDHITAGGNYGWNLREGLHPFGANGSGPRADLIEPIWEYDHGVGNSIIGGAVYRGRRLPELAGAYLYADYVTGRLWALRYDAAKKRVVANQPIADRKQPVLSFGEDEKGEVYYLTYSASGQGIYRFVRTKSAKGNR
jgi:glucose/arabinose dehydrogenase